MPTGISMTKMLALFLLLIILVLLLLYTIPASKSTSGGFSSKNGSIVTLTDTDADNEDVMYCSTYDDVTTCHTSSGQFLAGSQDAQVNEDGSLTFTLHNPTGTLKAGTYHLSGKEGNNVVSLNGQATRYTFQLEDLTEDETLDMGDDDEFEGDVNTNVMSLLTPEEATKLTDPGFCDYCAKHCDECTSAPAPGPGRPPLEEECDEHCFYSTDELCNKAESEGCGGNVEEEFEDKCTEDENPQEENTGKGCNQPKRDWCQIRTGSDKKIPLIWYKDKDNNSFIKWTLGGTYKKTSFEEDFSQTWSRIEFLKTLFLMSKVPNTKDVANGMKANCCKNITFQWQCNIDDPTLFYNKIGGMTKQHAGSTMEREDGEIIPVTRIVGYQNYKKKGNKKMLTSWLTFRPTPINPESDGTADSFNNWSISFLINKRPGRRWKYKLVIDVWASRIDSKKLWHNVGDSGTITLDDKGRCSARGSLSKKWWLNSSCVSEDCACSCCNKDKATRKFFNCFKRGWKNNSAILNLMYNMWSTLDKRRNEWDMDQGDMVFCNDWVPRPNKR